MSFLTLDEWISYIDLASADLVSDKDKLYEIAKEGYKKFNGENNIEVLWRLVRCAHKASAMAQIAKDNIKFKKLLWEADEWAKKGLACDSSCGEIHIWYACVCGKLSDHVGVKERIFRGKEVQIHLEEAVKLKPQDSIIYYVWGKWCVEVTNLSWIERNIASALMFEEVPNSSYQEAINKFKEADKLKPNWKANLFNMAKAYINLKDYKKAIELLDLSSNSKPADEEDLFCEWELLSLQKKYSKYRQR